MRTENINSKMSIYRWKESIHKTKEPPGSVKGDGNWKENYTAKQVNASWYYYVDYVSYENSDRDLCSNLVSWNIMKFVNLFFLTHLE